MNNKTMSPLAEELNAVLAGTAAEGLFSRLGRRIYFPRGIIAQTAEAKKTAAINATIGMAYDHGRPIILNTIAQNLPALTPEEAVAYAPTAGVEALRAAWKEDLARKNPLLRGKAFSLPVVVPGVTAGISYAADLFLDEGETMLTAEPCWDNYELIFSGRRNGVLRSVPVFSGREGLDTRALEAAVAEEAEKGVVRIILNFPNNPSGWTPGKAEFDAVVAIIARAAERGARVLVLCDDAYFGLVYEDGVVRESFFGALAALDERVLAVKIDGPTKEHFVWGLRTAFVTFAGKGLSGAHYDALVRKLMGLIRSSVSCANTPAQHLIMRALEAEETGREKDKHFDLLRARYEAVRRFIARTPAPPVLEALPFNSGYFMSFRCRGISAEDLRKKLLERGIGVIALGGEYLRVTFAAVEEAEIPGLYAAIYEAAQELA